jgi:beta-glucosidase
MIRRALIPTSVVGLLALQVPGAAQADLPYHNRQFPAERRAEDLLGRMTLDEKIGQMTQADSGSLP